LIGCASLSETLGKINNIKSKLLVKTFPPRGLGVIDWNTPRPRGGIRY